MVNNFNKNKSRQGIGRLGTNPTGIATVGCMDPTAVNYNINATVDDGECTQPSLGCTDTLASNYDSGANIDDGNCLFPGCTQIGYEGYDPNYNFNDGSCGPEITYGCTNVQTQDPGDGNNYPLFFNASNTFTYPCNEENGPGCVINPATGQLRVGNNCCCESVIVGCTDPLAVNYDEDLGANYEWQGNILPWTCDYNVYGCTDVTATNYNTNCNGDTVSATASEDPNCCEYPAYIPGCLNAGYYNSDCASITSTWLTASTPPCTDGVTDNDGSCTAFVYGCTEPSGTISTSVNYDCADGNADYPCNDGVNTDDGSCIGIIQGCTDPTAYNYDNPPGANVDNGSCQPFIYGCDDSGNWNWNCGTNNEPQTDPYVACNDGVNTNNDPNTCIPFIYGCDDANAMNFDCSTLSNAGSLVICTDGVNTFDNTCIYPIYGCTDPTAAGGVNFGTANTPDDPSSCYDYPGCTDNYFLQFWEQGFVADFDDGSCGSTPAVFGCMDANAYNFDCNTGNTVVVTDPTNNTNTGCSDGVNIQSDPNTCIAIVQGCMDTAAYNTNSSANVDDGSCDYEGPDCMDANASNYNPDAVVSDPSACIYPVHGCMDDRQNNAQSGLAAGNYDPLATEDDGTCSYTMPQHLDEGGMPEYSDVNSSVDGLDTGWTIINNPTSSKVLGVWDVSLSPPIATVGNNASVNTQFAFGNNGGALGAYGGGDLRYHSGVTGEDYWQSEGSHSPGDPIKWVRYQSSGGVAQMGKVDWVTDPEGTNGNVWSQSVKFQFEDAPSEASPVAIPEYTPSTINYTVNIGCDDPNACEAIPGSGPNNNFFINNSTCDYGCNGCNQANAANYDSTVVGGPDLCQYRFVTASLTSSDDEPVTDGLLGATGWNTGDGDGKYARVKKPSATSLGLKNQQVTATYGPGGGIWAEHNNYAFDSAISGATNTADFNASGHIDANQEFDFKFDLLSSTGGDNSGTGGTFSAPADLQIEWQIVPDTSAENGTLSFANYKNWFKNYVNPNYVASGTTSNGSLGDNYPGANGFIGDLSAAAAAAIAVNGATTNGVGTGLLNSGEGLVDPYGWYFMQYFTTYPTPTAPQKNATPQIFADYNLYNSASSGMEFQWRSGISTSYTITNWPNNTNATTVSETPVYPIGLDGSDPSYTYDFAYNRVVNMNASSVSCDGGAGRKPPLLNVGNGGNPLSNPTGHGWPNHGVFNTSWADVQNNGTVTVTEGMATVEYKTPSLGPCDLSGYQAGQGPIPNKLDIGFSLIVRIRARYADGQQSNWIYDHSNSTPTY